VRVRGRPSLTRALSFGSFRPERHLSGPKASPFVYIAFLAGPRTCLGRQLAYVESVYVLARMVLGYRLSIPDPASVQIKQVGAGGSRPYPLWNLPGGPLARRPVALLIVDIPSRKPLG
jgi:hypothetical protein